MNEPGHIITGLELTKGTSISEADRYKIAIEYAKLLYMRDAQYAQLNGNAALVQLNNTLTRLIDSYGNTVHHDIRRALDLIASKLSNGKT